jgi:hypothetical protein
MRPKVVPLLQRFYLSIHPSMLKSYRRILIEVGINISHLVTLDFSLRGPRLFPQAIYHPFRGYPSGCFDGLFDASLEKDGKCVPGVLSPPTEDRGFQDGRCNFSFKPASWWMDLRIPCKNRSKL